MNDFLPTKRDDVYEEDRAIDVLMTLVQVFDGPIPPLVAYGVFGHDLYTALHMSGGLRWDARRALD